MFVVEVTAALVTVILVSDFLGITKAAAGEVGRAPGFELQIAIWLWFTVYFATYAEALAEARGKAQAATLRKTRSETLAHRRRDDGTYRGRRFLRAPLRRRHRRPRGRDDPRRRRRHRRRGLRQRSGHHRRVGARPQGAGHGHPQQRHRRHDGHQRHAHDLASPPTPARPSSTG